MGKLYEKKLKDFFSHNSIGTRPGKHIGPRIMHCLSRYLKASSVASICISIFQQHASLRDNYSTENNN
jgi:hypothetical protein